MKPIPYNIPRMVYIYRTKKWERGRAPSGYDTYRAEFTWYFGVVGEGFIAAKNLYYNKDNVYYYKHPAENFDVAKCHRVAVLANNKSYIRKLK